MSHVTLLFSPPPVDRGPGVVSVEAVGFHLEREVVEVAVWMNEPVC